MDRRILGLAIACLTAFSLFAVLSADVSAADDDPPEPEPVEIDKLRGIVFDIPAEKDRVVIAGVTVKTWISHDRVYETAITDENGEFIVNYDSNVKYISFTMEEFTVKGVCSELHPFGDSGLYEIVLSESPSVEEGVHNLYDADGFTALISRSSAYVYGSVMTNVNGSEMPVKNAEVTLMSNKTMLKTYTDEDGIFEFIASKGVAYQMIVTASGLEDWSSEVHTSDEPVRITLVMKDHAIFLGMDLGHTIAIIGLVMLILLALITIYLSRKPEEVDGIYVVNDLTPREIVDEDSRSDE